MKRVVVILSLLGVCILVLLVIGSMNEWWRGGENSEEGSTPRSHEVAMRDFYFEPEILTIQQGDTVTWVNEGRGVHYVMTLRGERILDSKNIKSGESWSYTFVDAGEYDYFSPVYPGMLGTVVVA